MSKVTQHFSILRSDKLIARGDVILQGISLRLKRIRVEITSLKSPVPFFGFQVWWFALGPPEDLQGNPVTDVLTIAPGTSTTADIITLLRPIARMHLQYGVSYSNAGAAGIQRDVFISGGIARFNQPQSVPTSFTGGGLSSSYVEYDLLAGGDTFGGIAETSPSIITAIDNTGDCNLYLEYY